MLPKPGRCLSRMLPKLAAGADVRQCAVLPLHPARPAAARLRRACVAAHSRAAADPSEIPLRPSQIRTSRDYPKRIEQSTSIWALTMVTFPIEATRPVRMIVADQTRNRATYPLSTKANSYTIKLGNPQTVCPIYQSLPSYAGSFYLSRATTGNRGRRRSRTQRNIQGACGRVLSASV